MSPLVSLVQDTARVGGDAALTVDAAGAIAFTSEPAAGMLLLPGDPLRPEVTDVSVVLRALAEKFPSLRIAIAPEGDEPAMRARFGVTTFPSLLFVKDGAIVKTLSRMQAWATYEAAARALEGDA